jgi:hypothetical protein
MQLKSFATVVSLLGMSLVASNTHAGDAQGQITGAIINGANTGVANYKFYVFGGTHNSKPACATAGHFAFDTTTVRGKALFTIAIAASLAGRVVRATGSGTCSVIGDSETLTQLEVWTDDL